MMKKSLLLSFLLIGIVNFSYSQSFETSRTNIGVNNKVAYEGPFAYSYNNQNYVINLSVANGSYIEYNDAGTILSSGTLERAGDNVYRLIPVDIYSDAIIQGELYFKTISKTSSAAHIEIFTVRNGSEGELFISKVQ